MIKPFYRFEFKYEISESIARQIEAEIKKFGMKPDKNSSEDGSYMVTSLYFDTYDFSDYQDKAGGLLKRKKIRARIYEHTLDKSEKVTVEIKSKHETQNTKTKIKLSKEQWNSFINGKISSLLTAELPENDKNARDDIFWHLAYRGAKPRIVVRYKRKPFVNKSENLRINFDSNLEACKKGNLEYNTFMVPVKKGVVVMEIKYSYLMPSWLGEIIKKYNLKKDAFSKYGHAVEAVHRHNPLSR